MIDIYGYHILVDGVMTDTKTLIQSIPAGSESNIFLSNPKVSVKIGSGESMNMSIQPGSRFFNSFQQMRSYIQVDYDGDTLFFGRVLTIEDGFYGERKFTCEGAIAFFNDTYYPAIKSEDRPERPASELIDEILENHNDQVDDPFRMIYPGEVPGHYTEATSLEQRMDDASREYGNNGWTTTKSAIEDLTSHYGGLLRIRYSGGRLYLDWYKHYYKSSINSQEVKVGSNMLDFSNITEVSNIFTIIIPIGQEENGSEKVYISGKYFPVSRVTEFYTDEELNSGYHMASDYRDAIQRYGKIFRAVDLQDAKNEEELLQEAAKWVKENYQGGVSSFSIRAVDLHQIGENVEKILVGDRVRVLYVEGNNQIETRILTCTDADYDLYNPENNQYTFGIPANSTKGYGVTKKKSQDNKEETPKSSYSPDTRTDYEKWEDAVYKWLRQHQVWKKSNGGREGGPNSTRDANMFLRYSSALEVDPETGEKTKNAYKYLWDPHIGNVRTVGGLTIYDWVRDGQGRPRGTFAKFSSSNFSINTIVTRHIIEYVWDEYGVDLTKKAGNGKIDKPLVDESDYDIPNISLNGSNTKQIIDEATGNIQLSFSNVLSVFDSNNITDIMGSFNIAEFGFGGIVSGLGTIVEKAKIVMGVNDGKNVVNTIISTATDGIGNIIRNGFNLDETGGQIWKNVTNGIGVVTDIGKILFNSDEGDVEASHDVTADHNVNAGEDVTFTDGEGNQQSVRNLRITALDTENKVGWIVEEDEHGDLKFRNPGEMTLAIEEYNEGKMVVSRVAGELTYLGNSQTQYLTSVSLNHMDNVCGDFHYVDDPRTGIKRVYIDAGAGMRVRRVSYDDQGNPIYDPSGHLVRAEYGIYDEDSLKGGVIVSKLNDGTFSTTISGDVINLNTNTDFTQLVADENGLAIRVGTAETGIANVETTVSGHTITINQHSTTINEHGTTINQITGSALWTQRSSITGVVGEFEVVGSGSSKYLRIKSGGGMKIEHDNVEYGIYDAYTLTGGIMVEKINANSVTTHIKGNRVIIGNVDDSTATTLGVKINDMDGLIAAKATIVELNAAKGRISSLEADNVVINGALTVSGGDIFTTGNINAGLAQDKYIRGKTLRLIGASSSQGAQEATLSYSDVDGMIIKAAVSGNTLQLWKHGDNITGNPSITFSKATTLTGAWSSGSFPFTVNASPQNQHYSIGFGSGNDTNLSLLTNGSASVRSGSTTMIDIPMRVATVSTSTPPTITTRYSETIPVSVSTLLQTKSATSNGSTVTPDAGYIGLSSVSVNVAVDIQANAVGSQSRRAGATAVNNFISGATQIFSSYAIKPDGDYRVYYKFKVEAGGKEKYYYFRTDGTT